MKNRIRNKEPEGSYLQYTDGEEIFTEGSPGKEIYIIISGNVEVSQRIGGKNEVIATLGRGAFFGEMASFTDESRSATVIAVGNVFVRTLSMDQMFREMQADPEFMKDVCFRLAKRLKETTTQLGTMLLETRARKNKEIDTRGPKVSYLQKKVKEKDTAIENMRTYLEREKHAQSSWFWHLRKGKLRWLWRAFEVIVLLALLLIILRLTMPEYWQWMLEKLPWISSSNL